MEAVMPQVGILEAKTRFSALVDQVEAGGETVIITRRGRPVAKLLAADSDLDTRPRRRFGDDDLSARLDRLRDEIARAAPELSRVGPEQLKAMGRE
jgi:prevent-host-death family protein